MKTRFFIIIVFACILLTGCNSNRNIPVDKMSEGLSEVGFFPINNSKVLFYSEETCEVITISGFSYKASGGYSAVTEFLLVDGKSVYYDVETRSIVTSLPN